MATEPNEVSDEDMEMLAYREERHKQRMDVRAGPTRLNTETRLISGTLRV